MRIELRSRNEDIALVSLPGVLASAITVVAARMGRSHSCGTAASADRAAELDATIAQLSREVAVLRASQQVLSRATWSQLVAGPPAPVTTEKTAMPSPAAEEADIAATQDTLQVGSEPIATTFEREAPDADWANEARRILLQAHGAKELPGSHVDAECKSTLCRMTFSFDSRRAAELALSTIALGVPWQGMGSGMFEAATGRVVYYLARPGQKLPLAVAAAAPSMN